MLMRLAALTLLLLSACACPPRLDCYETPRDTLAAWQASLCAEDVEGEYRCLSAGLRRRMGNFATYHSLRTRLLEDNPAAAWLLARADLSDALREESYTAEGDLAFLSFEARGVEVVLEFEREAWITVTAQDGTQSMHRQEGAPARRLAVQGERQWLLFEQPRLPADLASVRSIEFEVRWMLRDIGGLAALSPAGPVQP
ncbi:MAG: hypothetical protein ACT4PU_12235 [Planctomycetota bacterium]